MYRVSFQSTTQMRIYAMLVVQWILQFECPVIIGLTDCFLSVYDASAAKQDLGLSNIVTHSAFLTL